MFNQDIYDLLEKEFEKNRIEEDVEEVLLDLAEALADKGIMDKEVSLKESYEKTPIEVTGICSDEEGEATVLIKKVKIGKIEIEIEDYFL
jgi:hypothetical protein